MNKLKFGHYYLIVFSLLIIFLVYRDFTIKNEIILSKTKVIVKFIKIESLPKTTNFYFGFFHKGNYIETCASGVDYSIFNSDKETNLIKKLKLNHYYEANYNPNYPKIIIVDKSFEIIDSLKIKEAGF